MTGKGTSIKSQIRPAQQLFDPQQTKLGECIRKYNPIDNKGGKYDYWNNDYYRDGYLYKDVNPMTYLQTEKVAPKMEEMKMFINQKAKKLDQDKYDDDEDPADEPDDDDEFDEDGEPKKTRSLVKELAEQLQSLENEATEVDSKLSPYVVGDLVQVISGELHNLVARITSVNQLNRTVTVTPSNSILTGEFTIEMSVLVKYVPAGSHVKVIGGRNMGQTGRVVNVKVMDGKPTAVILTDGINTEILCDVINLQVSNISQLSSHFC
jgi:transcription elongation factor